MLNAVAGLLDPRSGQLDIPARQRRGGVAYVLQATHANEHLPITVRETVTMGRYATAGAFRRLHAEDRAAVDRAMEEVAITDLAARPLRELSGGQRQRAFVAQGLAQEADVLLLDEPITGLDLVSRQHIIDAIVRRAGGRPSRPRVDPRPRRRGRRRPPPPAGGPGRGQRRRRTTSSRRRTWPTPTVGTSFGSASRR